MASTESVDIDTALKELLKTEADKVEYITVTLFDRQWQISNQINTFMALRAGEGDTQAFTQFLMKVAHPDERKDFQNALYNLEPMTADVLLLIINKLMEAVAAHPTKSSPDSSPTPAKKAVKPKSEDD